MMSSLVLTLAMGLLQFVTAWYLAGKFTTLETIISDLAARLHL